MLNPELEPFLSTWTAKWAELPPGATPKDRREKFEVIARDMRLPTPDDVDTEQEIFVDSEYGTIRSRVFRHHSDTPQPCLVYMHGGAWMQGSPETHWDITARIASWNQQTVVSLDYALAPEHPFPAAIHQSAAVVRWLAANAQQLNIDPTRISIGGDSAGANLAAALCHHFKDTEINLIAQLLIYPPVDFEMTRPSYVENANAPLLNVAGMPAVNAMYCPNPLELRNPLAAPIMAESHADLPPAFIAVAENDPLRDDGIDYAKTLQSAGVPVELDRGEGLIHGYLRAMEYCRASEENLKKMSAWLANQNAKAR